MADALVGIANYTLGTSSTTIEFVGIEGNYRDLVVVINGISTTGGTTVRMQFNGDIAGNYPTTYMNGDGTSVAQGTATNLTCNPVALNTAYRSFQATYYIYDYAKTDRRKSVLWNANQTLEPDYSAFFGAAMYGGYWNSTAAIGTITLRLGAGNFAAGTTVELFGVEG